MATTTQFYITPSDMLEYLYCPRFIYYQNVLDIPQNEDTRYKVQVGRTIHKKKQMQNPDYLRRRLGVVDKQTEVKLHSDKLGVRGIVDEILTLKDGTMAPLDYKYAEYLGEVYTLHEYQSVLYGMLIEENYNKPVNRGFLVFTRSNNKIIEVEHKRNLIEKVKKVLIDIRSIITIGQFPRKTYYKRACIDCCYNNICIQ